MREILRYLLLTDDRKCSNLAKLRPTSVSQRGALQGKDLRLCRLFWGEILRDLLLIENRSCSNLVKLRRQSVISKCFIPEKPESSGSNEWKKMTCQEISAAHGQRGSFGSTSESEKYARVGCIVKVYT